MLKTLIVCCTVFLLGGCERSSFSPMATGPLMREQVVIIRGFDNADTVTVGAGGFRVGGYYDFEIYDSLTINFSARRLNVRPEFDHILIKLGPAQYLSDSLFAQQKDFSFSVRTVDIAKARFAALTFIVADPEASLFLSQLRVIGWAAR